MRFCYISHLGSHSKTRLFLTFCMLDILQFSGHLQIIFHLFSSIKSFPNIKSVLNSFDPIQDQYFVISRQQKLPLSGKELIRQANLQFPYMVSRVHPLLSLI